VRGEELFVTLVEAPEVVKELYSYGWKVHNEV
jgi:hypothetical protein